MWSGMGKHYKDQQLARLRDAVRQGINPLTLLNDQQNKLHMKPANDAYLQALSNPVFRQQRSEVMERSKEVETEDFKENRKMKASKTLKSNYQNKSKNIGMVRALQSP